MPSLLLSLLKIVSLVKADQLNIQLMLLCVMCILGKVLPCREIFDACSGDFTRYKAWQGRQGMAIHPALDPWPCRL